MKKAINLFSVVAFALAIIAASAFTPPLDDAWGSAPGISCTTGTLVNPTGCAIQSATFHCKVLIGSPQQEVDAYASGQCGNPDYRLMRN